MTYTHYSSPSIIIITRIHISISIINILSQFWEKKHLLISSATFHVFAHANDDCWSEKSMWNYFRGSQNITWWKKKKTQFRKLPIASTFSTQFLLNNENILSTYKSPFSLFHKGTKRQAIIYKNANENEDVRQLTTLFFQHG
jgi:hypothetical protein